MLVRNWMSKKVITADVSTTMQQAINLMMDNRISMLPVMDDGKLVGIVTDRDLRRASPSDAALMDVRQILYHMQKLNLEAIMTRDPITIPIDFTIEETAEVLLKKNISGCPVIDQNGKIRGIISKNDLFKAIISMTGLKKRGIQFGLVLEDRPGSIREATDIIREYGARIASILTTYERVPEGFRNVYIRAFELNRDMVPELIEDLKKQVKILHMVDHRENKRVIYEDNGIP